MSSPSIHAADGSLRLKEPCGWFAAGASFRKALRILSDGAFKLFAHVCLEANRRTGRLEITQVELAKAIDKSRRIVGKYVKELERKEVCTVRSGRNQHARTCFEIRENYWPYRRTQEAASTDVPLADRYVNAIKNRFLAIGCTVGKFSARDVELAQDLQRRGIPLETVQDALLMGAVRKYASWFNGGSLQPIGSLAYFAALIAETQDRPFPEGYREYLEVKVVKFAREWAEKSAKARENGGCLGMATARIVQ